MVAITTRQTSGAGATNKGSPLTNTELDNNFINLNTAKIEADQVVALTNKAISSSTIDGTVIGGSSAAAGSFTTVSAITAATVPTMASGDNSNAAASTAFVASEISASGSWYHTNTKQVSVSVTIPSTHNAWAAGPIQIRDGITVTVSDNATLSIV